jgi:hypothetical protein
MPIRASRPARQAPSTEPKTAHSDSGSAANFPFSLPFPSNQTFNPGTGLAISDQERTLFASLFGGLIDKIMMETDQ